MNAYARILRAAAKLRFRLLGLATIQDIPTDQFKTLVAHLSASGWTKIYEYEGFDAWIDYGRVDFKKSGVSLRLEWDNWTEGSVEGPRQTVCEIAQQHGYAVTDQWRWAIYDQKVPESDKSLERTRGS